MPWGEAAAEQAEKDQPSEPRTCLRPDGASPELPSLLGREDFGDRMTAGLAAIRFHAYAQIHKTTAADKVSYHAERQRAAEAKSDQLVLMRAKQILDEAEERRQSVLRKLAKAQSNREK